MWIYESHTGGLYTSEEQIDYKDRYCEQCGDSDWQVGYYESAKDFVKDYVNEIDYYGSGGFNLEYIYKNVVCMFEDTISLEEMIQIVKENKVIEYNE